MSDPILVMLTRLRDFYAIEYTQIQIGTSILPDIKVSKRMQMAACENAIAELDRQIAALTEEQEEREPLHCDVSASKRYADTHEQ